VIRLIVWLCWAAIGWCIAMGYAVWFPTVWDSFCKSVPTTVNLGVVEFHAPLRPQPPKPWWPFAQQQPQWPKAIWWPNSTEKAPPKPQGSSWPLFAPHSERVEPMTDTQPGPFMSRSPF
jgi:hypothetical protein